MSIVKKERKTGETEISVLFNPRGTGKYNISTGINFFNHMLEQFACHGGFDLTLEVISHDRDNHHIVEDVGITLGSAFLESLGDKKGIKRYSSVILPMDEALVLCAVDLSGRAYCKASFQIREETVSDFETVLLIHFFNSFVSNSGITLHIKQLEGIDPHHIIECSFKSFARTLSAASKIDLAKADFIPSTKGVL